MSDPIVQIRNRFFRSTLIGPPQSGTWHRYDLLIDLLGQTWACAVAGTPGTWQEAPLAAPQPLAITDVSPLNSVENTDPAFTVTGTGFNEGLQNLGVFIEGADPAIVSWVAEYTVDSDTQITIPAGVIPAAVIAANAQEIAAPFQARLRVERPGGATVTSPVFDVSAFVPLDPMSDAQFLAFSGGPGQLSVNVNTGEGYSLASYDGISQHQIVVPYSPPPGGTEYYSFAVWHRKVTPGGGLNFATSETSAFTNFTLYNGAMVNIESSFTGQETVQSAPMSYPEGDVDWHLTVVVRGDPVAGMVRLYVDGAFVSETPRMPSMLMDHPSPTLLVGVDNPPGAADVIGTGAVWTRALTADEVTALWANTVFP